MHSMKPGRSSRAPDMTSWKILPAPVAVSASVCCSRVCPMVETRAYPITVGAVVDAEAVLTTSVHRKYRSVSFPNSDYMDILSGQHVVGKHNCVDGTEACPETDRFRYGHSCVIIPGRADGPGRRARVRSSCRQAPRPRSRTDPERWWPPPAAPAGRGSPIGQAGSQETLPPCRPRSLPGVGRLRQSPEHDARTPTRPPSCHRLGPLHAQRVGATRHDLHAHRLSTPRTSRWMTSDTVGQARCRRRMTSATNPVHPVWWVAPSPAALSPWKYSWNCRLSCHRGSVCSRCTPPKHGRIPSDPTKKIDTSRCHRSAATASSVTLFPDPVGYSMVRSSPKNSW